MLGFIYNRNFSICFLGFTVFRLEKPKQTWKSSKAEERNSGEAKKQKSREAKEQKSTKTKRDGKKPTKKNPPLFLRSFTKQSKSIDIPILGGASARAVWILNILNPQAIWICWTPSPASKNSWTSGQGDI